MRAEQKIRMSPRVTLYVQRKMNAADSSTDDVIRIFEDDDYLEMYRIVYTAPDLRKSSTFYMTKSKAVTYVADLLQSLTHDAIPFEAIQVTSAIFPSVVYHVSELDSFHVRHLIEDMVATSLRNVDRS
jgi:hypothetical protein